MVLTVVYAPPGTNGGHSASSVSYQSGSTTGTVTSSSRSFKDGVSASVEASGSIFGNGGGVGVAFDYSNSTDSESVEIKKSVTATISQAGPSQDGINHDQDEIWLLLRPTINLALSDSTTDWMLANTNATVQVLTCGVVEWPSTNAARSSFCSSRCRDYTADLPGNLGTRSFGYESICIEFPLVSF